MNFWELRISKFPVEACSRTPPNKIKPNFFLTEPHWSPVYNPARKQFLVKKNNKKINDGDSTLPRNLQLLLCGTIIWSSEATGSGRVLPGYRIWPKCSPGFGKKQNILTGFWIPLISGKWDSLKFGHGMQELFLSVGKSGHYYDGKLLRWNYYNKKFYSKLTRWALCGVSFQTTTAATTTIRN